MSLDSYVTLGRSGLRVSPFCLGHHDLRRRLGLGQQPPPSPRPSSREYLDRGGNFIDTANIYTNGHSEKIIGDFFAARKGRRDRTVIAHEVLLQPACRRPERRRCRTQGDRRAMRGVAAPAADRLYRSLLDA